MLKSKKVTLKEVAAAVNLAVPTVSQILNGKKNFCSEEQCKRVRRTAQEMGYVTNIGYRIMTGQETHTVGIMVACQEHMEEEHYRTIVLNLLKNFASRGCAAFCYILSTDGDKALQEIQEYIGRGVERFVFLGQPFGSDKIFHLLEDLRIPFIGNTMAFKRYVVNDSSGRRDLLCHIDRKTGGKFQLFWWKSSSKVFKRFFPEPEDLDYFLARNRDIPAINGYYYDETFRIGYELTADVLDNSPEIKGLFFPNDAFAIGAAKCLTDRKITGFHLAGFNGEKELLRFPYPVSTAIFDLERIADLLAERVFDNNECTVTVPTALRLVP